MIDSGGDSHVPDLDIGVIYSHERQFMPRLLWSIGRASPGIRARVILVDNASEEGVARWAGYCARPLILRNRERLGYAANLNRVLEAASARYVLLLNTDMYFDPHEPCLSRMVGFMDEHGQCGLASCRILHEDGTEAYAARRFQSLPVILGRRLGLARVFRRAVADYLYLQHSPGQVFECDWVSGCFMMVRRRAWQDVGGFDIRFKKYFEDVDFCSRMASAGWQVLYNGTTYAHHLEQRASKRLFSVDAWRHLESYVRWLFKRRMRALQNRTPAKR